MISHGDEPRRRSAWSVSRSTDASAIVTDDHERRRPSPSPDAATAGTTGRGRGWCGRRSSSWSCLALSILLFRTFAAEAYVVPTGSMAPTLLG